MVAACALSAAIWSWCRPLICLSVLSCFHSALFCAFYKPRMLGPVDPYYHEDGAHPPAKMAVCAGDAVLMDTRVMHCGGANHSERNPTP